MTSPSTRVIDGAEFLSAREFARRIGLSHNAVAEAVRAGRLQRSVKRIGKSIWIDPRTGPREFQNSLLRPSAQTPYSRNDREDLVLAQKLYRLEELKLLQMKRLRIEGSLVDLKRVQSEVFKAGRAIRDAILDVPRRVADRVLATRDRGEIVALLEEELEKALRGLQELLKADFTP